MAAAKPESPSGRPILAEMTVLVPTLGRPCLRDCLRCLEQGTAWPGRLLVVDQGGDERTATWVGELAARGFPADHRRSSTSGRSAALNEGLREVRSPLVGIIDDDCLVEPEWLQCMTSRLQTSGAMIVTGKVLAEGDHALAVHACEEPALYTRPLFRFDPPAGGNLGAPIEILRRVGGFDEDPGLHACEDNDYGYRLLRCGVPILYAPEVVVRHLAWRSHSALRDRYRQYALCQGAFYGKYLRRGDLFFVARIAYDLLRGFYLSIRGPLIGDRERAYRGRSSLVYLLPGVIRGFAVRGIEPPLRPPGPDG